MFEQTVDIERIEQIINLFGNFDENIKRIEKKYKVSVTSHGSQIRVRGDVTDVMNAVRTIEGLLVMINKGEQITDQTEGVVMAADSDQKNIQIVGTASMNTYDVALRVGKTKQLVCNGTTGKMVWKSSNPKVATVDKKGLVKAIKPGKAMISVSGGNLIGSMTCKVGVSKKITTKQARRKIMAMKKTYKEGQSWTNENRQYFWEATNCQCYGCIALCGEISDKVFGKYAPVTKHSNFSRIKAGDHIRIGNEHSVMVLQKNGNTLTVVEGNYNATVHWGRKITKKELQESGFYVETRY